MPYLRCGMIAVVLLGTSLAYAQSNAKQTPAAAKEAQSAEQAQVLTKLHHANKMEIKAGKLAKHNSESPNVQSYGQMLITDHEQADKAVRAYAEGKGVELKEPAELSAAEQQAAKDDAAAMDKLDDLKGNEFDRAFVSAMLTDHQKAIQMLKTARADSKDSEFRALLDKLLPVLQKHRARAESLQQRQAK